MGYPAAGLCRSRAMLWFRPDGTLVIGGPDYTYRAGDYAGDAPFR